MAKITGAFIDVNSRAVRVTTAEDEKHSEIVLSADFCHYCIDDLASEFEKFLKAKGYDIMQKKTK